MTQDVKRKSFNFSKLFFYIYCVFLALLVIVPFYIVFVTSITSLQELMQTGVYESFNWWPKYPTLQAYIDVLTNDPNAVNGISTLLIGFFNTLWMALLTVGSSLFFASLAAYAYAKVDFKGKEIIFMIQLATMMIPSATMTIPSIYFYEALGWVGTRLPVLIPHMFGTASAIFFFRSYFLGISNEYIEAAQIDGLGRFGCFIKIVLPLSVPAIIAQFIFMFVSRYNSYTDALLYLDYDPAVYTLQYAVDQLTGINSEDNQKCAVALVALIPLIVLYLCSQKLFIEGIQVGGGKE